jgi:MSHA biogenesis protein MshO
MMRSRAHSGFTLAELVVTITISAIVMVFVTMFMAAPIDAYQAQSRRAGLVAATSDAWPRLERDLRIALPNSVRWRRNGSFVVLEMLSVVDEARYVTPPSASFDVAGTATPTGAVFRNLPTGLPFTSSPAVPYYVSVDASKDPYTSPGVLTSGAATITIKATAAATAGEATVTIAPAPVPALSPGSPRRRVFLVTGPVTYLCDETAGTLSRYMNYPLAANQATRDSPAKFSAVGATVELIARGLTTCNFDGSPIPASATTSQTVTVQLTSAAANGDTVTLLHTSRAEFVP